MSTHHVLSNGLEAQGVTVVKTRQRMCQLPSEMVLPMSRSSCSSQTCGQILQHCESWLLGCYSWFCVSVLYNKFFASLQGH